MKAEFGLRRVLGLKELVAIEVGTTVGAGVFVLTGTALEMGGPLLPFAFLLAAVPVVLMMLTLAMLGSAVPTVGGTYRYPSRLLSPGWAFVGVWVFALGMVFGAFPLYALRGSEYLLGVFPWFEVLDPAVRDQWIRILAVAWLTIFFLANLCGLAIAAAVQGIMVLVLLAALIHFGILGLGAVSLENMQPPLPNGIGGFLASSALDRGRGRAPLARGGGRAPGRPCAEVPRPGRAPFLHPRWSCSGHHHDAQRHFHVGHEIHDDRGP
jgi:APA family basic amino acid/polyamine antiporter